jgi:hypothetical protein
MTVYEYVGNLHVHTSYSDGEALHAQVAQAAGQAGLDFIIVTDHNVWVDGLEQYYGKVLLLMGEEVHDVRRKPQANHLLVYGAGAEMVLQASDPQALIDAVNQHGGFCYLAHPYEYSGRIGDSEAIPWLDWDVTGYVGFELWNYMSEFKALASRNVLAAIYYAYFPDRGIRGPFRDMLRAWDHLLTQGLRIPIIGNADAHATVYTLGPFQRILFPYEYLFRCINTHILTDHPFNGFLEHDKTLVYDALRAGRTWIGYDLLASTEGFQFLARSGSNQAQIGQELVRTGATIFEIHTPQVADIRLVFQGKVIARERGKYLKHTTDRAGAYRVEVYRQHKMVSRGWIFSSPIYVKEEGPTPRTCN